MSNIVNDIVDNIEIKPNKTKLYIKWVVSIAISLITLAFVFGQFKSSFFNRLDKLETTVNQTKASVDELKTEVNAGFIMVDNKINKVYDDGLEAFNDFQVYNNKQLGLIIDYGSSNKDLLKRMLEVNTIERSKNVENQLEQAKSETVTTNIPEPSIRVTPLKDKEYLNIVYFIAVESNDTTFNVVGATKDFINKINKNRYEVGAIIQNDTHTNRYDFSYRNK